MCVLRTSNVLIIVFSEQLSVAMFRYCKTLFRHILILRSHNVGNSLYFNFADFPVNFIKQFVSCFFWCLKQMLLSKFVPHYCLHYTVCSKKSDAKIKITITAINLIRIKYPLSRFNYHLSDANVANFNKIHSTVFEQQLFEKWSSKTEVSNIEKSP